MVVVTDPIVLDLNTKHSIGAFNIDENLFFWMFLLKLSKTPEGMKLAVGVLEKVVSGSLDAIGKLATGSHAGTESAEVNYVAAYAAARLTNLYMERFGLLTRIQSAAFSQELIVLTAAIAAKDSFNDVLESLGGIMKGLTGLIPAVGGLGV